MHDIQTRHASGSQLTQLDAGGAAVAITATSPLAALAVGVGETLALTEAARGELQAARADRVVDVRPVSRLACNVQLKLTSLYNTPLHL